MKKTLLFLIAATAMMMTGCSNDDFGGATQGMTLNAIVEQPASRATMTEETDGNYQFSFTDNDKISVGNTTLTSDYYIFTKSGEKFSCAKAKPADSDVDWYAYFPSTTVSLDNQTGDLAGVANYYACAGKTESATTGADGLTIALKPKVAILRIVTVDDNNPTCDINVKTADDKWVSGLEATKLTTEFIVKTSNSKVSLLNKQNAGTYYIAVPAGVKIAIYNGETLLRTTKAGLTAGKYYTVPNVPVTGTAEATINGKKEMVKWVQLWAGGPKFATQNVAKRMNWTTAVKNEFWGGNWRVPTKDEMGLSANDAVNVKKVNAVYCIENGVLGFKFTGITPGYTNVSLFLPANSGALDYYGEATYWTATQVGTNNAGYQLSLIGGGDVVAMCHYAEHGYDGDSYVRPVLVEK